MLIVKYKDDYYWSKMEKENKYYVSKNKNIIISGRGKQVFVEQLPEIISIEEDLGSICKVAICKKDGRLLTPETKIVNKAELSLI